MLFFIWQNEEILRLPLRQGHNDDNIFCTLAVGQDFSFVKNAISRIQ